MSVSGANKMVETNKFEFESGDIVREEHPKPSPVPGVDETGKVEYKIRWRVKDVDDDDLYYYVETSEYDNHLFTVGVLHLNFEKIDEEESEHWPKEGGML